MWSTDQFGMFIRWLWPASLNTSVVIALILLIRALLKDRFAIRWTYWLWLFVLIRMLIPWVPQSPVSLFNLWSRPGPPVANRLPSVLSQETAGSTAAVALSADTTPKLSSRENALQSRASRFPGGAETLPLIWLAGALVVAGFGLVSDIRLWLRVRQQRLVTDGRILDLFEDCKSEMGVHTVVGLILTDRIKSPCIFGVIRPRVLLPVGTLESLTEDQLRFVFLHELAHLKRWDNVLGWFMLLAQVLHWFNPLVWYSFYRMRTDRELACDFMVLSAVSDRESTEYGSTIMDLSTDLPRLRSIPSVAGIAESRSLLKRRIKMIAEFRPKAKSRPVFVVAVLLVAALVTLTDAQSYGQRMHSVVGHMPQAMFDNLLVYYSFDKDGGNRAVDISGMDFHGRLRDGVYRSGGRIKGALQLNGESTQIVLNDMTLKAYTFAAWVKTDTEGINNRVLMQLHQGDQSYSIQGAANAPFSVYLDREQEVFGPGHDLEVGRWMHVVVTFDGRSVIVYCDGKKSYAGTGHVDTPVSGTLYIGGADAWKENQGFWQGALDEVALFNQALSAAQVEQLYGMYGPHPSQSPGEVTFVPYRDSFRPGDSIVIDRIEGTAATLTPGNTYTVTGHYTLSSCDQAMLHVYATNGETQSKQGPAVKRGSGPFTRIFKFIGDGYPHLSYYPVGGGSGFGGVYFKNPDGPTLGGRPERNKASQRPRPTDAAARANVAVKDMKVRPYEGGLFQVVASMLNTSDVPVGRFSVYFYVNDPGKEHPKNHGAGPIEPGKQWNEGTMPFLLNEGFNTIEVALDSKNEIRELSETDNQLLILVKIHNGQVEKVIKAQ